MDVRLCDKLSDLKSVVKVIREELDHNISKLSKHIFETQMVSHDHQLLFRKAMSEAQKVRASNDQAMEVVNIIQEEMALVVSLIVQDEDDRNSLALVGVQTRSNEMDVRPETRARKKYIDIDP
jgi:hypothetical protein